MPNPVFTSCMYFRMSSTRSPLYDVLNACARVVSICALSFNRNMRQYIRLISLWQIILKVSLAELDGENEEMMIVTMTMQGTCEFHTSGIRS